MDRYFTIMVIPEREKGVRSIRVPRTIFQAFVFMAIVFTVLLGILSYDYWKILDQVYENKHLTIENRQLKEQIQLFNMKVNALAEDLDRIQIFERKLRIITGLDKTNLSYDEKEFKEEQSKPNTTQNSSSFQKLKDVKNYENDKNYIELKNLYEQKIATNFGLQEGYAYTKEWSELTKQSFVLADRYAQFDYKFNELKKYVTNLEVNIHSLDEFLLDKESLLNSTPTLMPTKGWVTSFYGPRISPTSNRLKMHEGIDIGAKTGTPIVSPADGVVAYSGTKPGFGMFVQIDHGYGVETIFAHAKSLDVRKGQAIKRGTVIARIGSTGYSTGPHVHYEVRVNGTPVDPLYYMLD